MNDFHKERKELLKNPPKEIPSGTQVICVSSTSTLTEGKIYTVRGYFRFLNTYGGTGWKYPQWDEFITLKNDTGYTVKVNLRKFKVQKKICTIVNSHACYLLEVDGQTISFNGNNDYFEEHYKKLGYEIVKAKEELDPSSGYNSLKRTIIK